MAENLLENGSSFFAGAVVGSVADNLAVLWALPREVQDVTASASKAPLPFSTLAMLAPALLLAGGAVAASIYVGGMLPAGVQPYVSQPIGFGLGLVAGMPSTVKAIGRAASGLTGNVTGPFDKDYGSWFAPKAASS